MKALEGYFDNFVAAAVNKKLVLEELVANNTKLAATKENLVAIVKKVTNDIKYLEMKTSRLKKGGQRKRDTTLCPHCKKEAYHAGKACFEVVKNKDKRPTGWKSSL